VFFAGLVFDFDVKSLNVFRGANELKVRSFCTRYFEGSLLCDAERGAKVSVDSNRKLRGLNEVAGLLESLDKTCDFEFSWLVLRFCVGKPPAEEHNRFNV